MTPSGDPLWRAFENFLKPPQESHHFKFLLCLFKFSVHIKAEWLSGLRRWKFERMWVRMKVEGGCGVEPQSQQYCWGIVKLIKTNNLGRSFDYGNILWKLESMYKLFVIAWSKFLQNFLNFCTALQVLVLDYRKFVIPRDWICSVAESKFYKNITDFRKRLRTGVKIW